MAWLRIDKSQVSNLLDGFISKLFLVAIFNFRNLNWRYLHIQGLCMGYVTGYTPEAFLVWYLQFRYLKWPLIFVTTSRPSFRGWKTPTRIHQPATAWPTEFCAPVEHCWKIFQCCPAETRTLIVAAVTHIYGTTLPWKCTVSVSGRRTIDTAPSLPGVMPISPNTM